MAEDGTVKKTIHRAILSANMEMGSVKRDFGNRLCSPMPILKELVKVGKGGEKWINAQQMAEDGTVKKTIHRAILSANMERGSV
ncbi:hypothetical protein CEXT_144331 [Caerostris extrusa]|uniref:Uncharacterized protein n=1 Tax=Caerostris extrusa TaxID=172846 RepID=A0AAV4Y7T8_CAEEX|nr:hypothetical protein CEXT_144331 [Caerostris extrusa]